MSLFSTEDLAKKKPDRAKSGSVPFAGSNLLTIGNYADIGINHIQQAIPKD